MSLLLEALKKAEKAKEEAQRRARGEPPELRLEGDPATGVKPVLTRPDLPDIGQALDIVSDEIGPRGAPASAAMEESPRQGAQASPPRAAARQVFEAKFREPNPRMPFYMALGVLGIATLSTAGYFWYQLRPPPPLAQAAPARAAQPATVAATAPVLSAAAPAANTAIPGLPNARAAAPKPPPAPAVETVRESPAPAVAAPRPKPEPRAAATRAGAPAPKPAPPRAPVAPAASSTPRVHPKVDSGYAAYLAGDLPTARLDYQEARRDDPANRDALLGLAAIDVRTGRLESAEATYLRLLQLDPNDAHAQASLIALRGAQLDPLATESRVKNLLAADPGANVLHFTLGNQLAQQGRWPEAQQQYFKAFAAYPDNPDFAYNLAVSLDHLRQPRLALEYYQRALALAERRGASFDPDAVRTRAAQLAENPG